MDHDRIVPQQWMLQTREIRQHLAHVFNVPLSGVSEIRDQEVITDGHTVADLSAITKDRMAEYVGSEESFGRLWELTVRKAYAELHPPIGVIEAAPKKTKSKHHAKTTTQESK